MYQEFLNFLANSLGEDSRIYLTLESFLGQIGETNFILILSLISITLSSIFLYNLFWLRYKKEGSKRGSGIDNYSDYIEKDKIKLLLITIVVVPFIFLFFLQGLGLVLIEKVITWGDSGKYTGIGFLFGYKTESLMYQVYDLGRHFILIIMFFYIMYSGIKAKTIGETKDSNGNTKNYEKRFKTALLTTIIIILTLFTSIIGSFFGELTQLFSNQTLEEYVNGSEVSDF